ncbi:hypothetical protein [Photobacterium damselae]|uniref:hypothetical protein n=1 Tax=Photobacterium damselae TaxID=38293 RepID=UPI001F2FC5CB|nr:hypothetical protein [Photobacterium damselae]UKA12839.1 hypothetical protein IHC91_20835 [Photobacterium damselae subsp. damselae]
MAKIDYSQHQLSYEKLLEDNPLLTVREYCENEGLNYNSARRYMRNPSKGRKVENGKKLAQIERTEKPKGKINWKAKYFKYLVDCEENPTLSIAQFAALNKLAPATTRREFATLKRNGEHKDQCAKTEKAISAHKEEMRKAKHNSKILKNKGKVSKVQKRESAHQNTPRRSAAHDHSSDPLDHRDHLGRFMSGNRFSLVHGGYADIANLDTDLVEVALGIDPLNLANEILAARTQYLSMQRYLAQERSAIIELYDSGETIKGFDDEPISLNKALADLEFSSAGKLRSLESSLMAMAGTAAKIQTDIAKIQIKTHETPLHSTQVELDIRKEIMKNAEAEEWTAIKTARACETFGISIPVTVLEEMKREIANYEPEVDDNGITDEELDELTAEARRKTDNFIEKELPARREELQRLIEEQELKEQGGHQQEDLINDFEEPEHDEGLLDDGDDDENFPFDDIADFSDLGGD